MVPKILVLTRYFWPEGGGAELATYLVVKNVLGKWSEVTIVSGTAKPIPDVVRYARYVYSPLFKASAKLEVLVKILLRYHALEKLIEAADAVYIPSNAVLPVAILARRINPDVRVVVHLHDYQPVSYSSVVLHDMSPGLRTDILVERYDYNSILRAILAGVLRPVNELYSLALDYADTVIAVSRRQLEIVSRYVPTVERKAVVIYNPPPPVKPVDKEPIRPPTLLYTGGGRFTKGFHVLLRASLELFRRGRAVSYFIAKDVSQKWLRLIEKLNKYCSNCYKILGSVRHEDLLNLHRTATALVIPSVHEEPLPYTVVESILLGTIPVASRVGGISEIVEGTYAEKLLFEPGNYLELADRIEYVATLSREELIDIGMSLREAIARKLDLNHIEENFKRAFDLASRDRR